jgi:hypothetical protein
MASLKGYIPTLAKIVGLTPAALYERQRALVAANLVRDVTAGRGPGSGVRATAHSVALLLISVLATDSLGRSENRTRDIADARPVGRARCRFTGQKSFAQALTYILEANHPLVTGVQVSRTADRAAILHTETGPPEQAVFVGVRSIEPDISATVTLSQRAFRQIAAEVQAMNMGRMAL